MVNVFTNKSFLTIPLDDLPDEILARVMSNRLRNMAVSRRFASIKPKPRVWAKLMSVRDVRELAHMLGMGLVDVMGMSVLFREDEVDRDDGVCRAMVGMLRMCLPQCRSLRGIRMGNYFKDISILEDEGAALLAPALRQCPLLEQLSLVNCGITNNSVFSLATAISNMPRLRILNLSHNNIEYDGVKSLVASLSHCKQLEDLDLYNNGIRNEGVMGLTTLLSQCPSLRKLNLGGNYIGGEGVARLAAVLPLCPLLENMVLTSIGFDEWPGVLQPLAVVLPRCPMLTELDISHSALDLESTMALAEAIPQCVNLDTLMIEMCYIDQDSVGVLAAAFARAPRLRYVDMRHNNFSDATLLFEVSETRVPTIEIEWESDSEDNESDNNSYGHSDSEYSDSDGGG